MSKIDPITGAIERAKRTGPSRYRCEECGREFEVDAPPSRAVCSECWNDDVSRIER